MSAEFAEQRSTPVHGDFRGSECEIWTTGAEAIDAVSRPGTQKPYCDP
ncbi:hypothetical protein BF49_0792 [Bradyrhizobium sp.]|nr:hypothetical protein BF49_0792 [Bradyrhizobium sp.]